MPLSRKGRAAFFPWLNSRAAHDWHCSAELQAIDQPCWGGPMLALRRTQERRFPVQGKRRFFLSQWHCGRAFGFLGIQAASA